MFYSQQYDDNMGHFGGMSDLRDMDSGTSATTGIYGGDLNRSMPPMAHLSHNSSMSHFNNPVTPIHNIQTPGPSNPMDERISESEITMKTDKDAIYQ